MQIQFMLRVKIVNKLCVKKILLFIFLFCLFLNSFGQDQNISEGNIFDGEPYIAVNPENSQHLVVAWMGYFPYTKVYIKTKVSFDGGQSWSSLNYIPHTNASYGSADPSLAFDNSGNIFLSFIDYNKNTQEGAVFVTKSTDGGLTWGAPTEVINANSDIQKPIDRPWISIDNSGGTYDGTIYVTSMPPAVFGYLPPPYHPYFIKSTNGGQSFETWRYLDTLNWLAGNVIPQPMPTLAFLPTELFMPYIRVICFRKTLCCNILLHLPKMRETVSIIILFSLQVKELRIHWQKPVICYVLTLPTRNISHFFIWV